MKEASGSHCQDRQDMPARWRADRLSQPESETRRTDSDWFLSRTVGPLVTQMLSTRCIYAVCLEIRQGNGPRGVPMLIASAG
jgi:hypothetical protein